ncbi:MAG TPA: maleylpyruvate isomerase family mycothiol-dependent enzyme [Pseudonocardiaceae bacterium]|nr:maleylpyruvate isomerase family mycothiol-dependent enzyme [Pseudonocardiaceae bacterium]
MAEGLGERWPATALAWVAAGQARFERAVAECSDLREPSRLPGWTRGHVVTHVARNAEGLVRLLTWARTGIETPMYPSLQARAADIEAGAGRPQAEQLNDLRSTGAAFATATQQLSPEHWAATVRHRHGLVSASTVPWMRVREVWLHLVDLDAGVELDVLPEDIATALVRDVAGWMETRVPTRIELRIPGTEPVTFGPENSARVPVSGPVQELAGWLTGRSHGDRLTAPDGLPELPHWL